MAEEVVLTEADFMKEAIRLSEEGMQGGSGGPFGAVIVKCASNLHISIFLLQYLNLIVLRIFEKCLLYYIVLN
tara:strand:- start:1434 stop:1652 length:219 start_codon:yes stop_codon:yes gene_type:complete